MRLKRLERGTYRWPVPEAGETKVRIGAEEMALLLGGLDWPSTQRRRWWRRLPSEESVPIRVDSELFEEKTH